MLSARLDGGEPLATLGRGYAISAHPVRRGDQPRRPGECRPALVTTLAEGHLRVRVEEVDNG